MRYFPAGRMFDPRPSIPSGGIVGHEGSSGTLDDPLLEDPEVSLSTTQPDRRIDLTPCAITDSRGDPTVEVELRNGSIRVVASVPAGKTKGGDEARTVTVEQALANVRDIIQPLLWGLAPDLRSHASLIAVEKALIEKAGPNCTELGANALLPVSIALWRCAAMMHGLPLYQYIRNFEPELANTNRVKLFSNVLNGGYHALRKGEVLGRDRFEFQEMQIVPQTATSYREALSMCEQVDLTLTKRIGERFGADRSGRADEAGLTVKGLGDNAAALELLMESIRQAGFEPGREMKVTLDPASSHLHDPKTGTYGVSGRRLTREEYGSYLLSLLDTYPGAFESVEDPLEENDWEGLKALAVEIKKRGVLVVGDDFYVTQESRLRRGIADGSANGLLVKPNQNGSLHGTLEAMKLARKNNIRLVISHRSGETLDETIADVALAVGAHGIKTGAPQPERIFPDPGTWYRRRKYLRLIEIEESL